VKKILIVISIVVALLGIGYYLWWGGIISEVKVNGTSAYEDDMVVKITSCTESFKGRSIWGASVNQLTTEMKTCDIMIKDVTIVTKFPRKVEVNVTYYEPLAKLPLQLECELLIPSSQIKLPNDRCLLYNLPVIKGVETLTGNPVTQFLEILARELKAQSIVATQLEYRGDLINSWVIVRFSTKKESYIPVSADITKKVALLKASIVGLEDAKEKYSIIDLRFDRVVYK
jgi:cell division septal protein FtsQ